MKKLFTLIAALLVLGAPLSCAATPRHHKAPRQEAPVSVTVWVNTPTGVYHYPGSRWYGRTKHGEYMSESQAIKDGYRPARNGQ